MQLGMNQVPLSFLKQLPLKQIFSLTSCKLLILASCLLTPEIFQALTSEQQVHHAADKI